jgi:peptide methionine sulfoxide reductase MsrA
MRQRSDVGPQYRSTIYTTSKNHLNLAEKSLDHYQIKLTEAIDKKINYILGDIRKNNHRN